MHVCNRRSKNRSWLIRRAAERLRSAAEEQRKLETEAWLKLWRNLPKSFFEDEMRLKIQFQLTFYTFPYSLFSSLQFTFEILSFTGEIVYELKNLEQLRAIRIIKNNAEEIVNNF